MDLGLTMYRNIMYAILSHMKQNLCIYLLCIFLILPAVLSADDNDDQKVVFFDQGPNTFIQSSYDGETVQIRESVTIGYKGNGVQRIMLTFSSGENSGYEPRKAFHNQESINYQIYDSTTSRNVLKDVDAPEASGNQDFLTNSLNHEFGPGDPLEETFTYDIEIPADQIMEGSGVYSNTFTVSLYTRQNFRNLRNIEIIDTREVTVLINAAGIIQASLVPPGGEPDFFDADHTLDFGILEPGKWKAAELFVKASTTYSVSLESQNRGVLLFDSSKYHAEVPYSFEFDSQEIDVTKSNQPIEVLKGASATGQGGRRHDIEIIIGEFGIVPSGRYADVISFTISAD